LQTYKHHYIFCEFFITNWLDDKTFFTHAVEIMFFMNEDNKGEKQFIGQREKLC